VAGGLLAMLNGFVTPDVAGFLHSVEFVTMVVIGGLASVPGAIVGAALLVLLPQVLTVFHDYEHAVLGLLIMLFMIFLRAGIVPGLAGLMRRRRAA
jgi:branched-chain amino acid transport system permease protein